MVKQHNLDPSYMNTKYSWAMADWAICRWWDVNMSMAKARKFGCFGTVDWADSIAEMFEEAVEMRIIPPFTKSALSDRG
jgi:hypothetical protein